MGVKRCSWGICNADSRYPDRYPGVRFIPFAKPKTQLNKCLRWIRACGRPPSQLNVNKINRNVFICSRHFVDGKPTDENPDPVNADGSKVRKRKTAPKPEPYCITVNLADIHYGAQKSAGIDQSTMTDPCTMIQEYKDPVFREHSYCQMEPLASEETPNASQQRSSDLDSAYALLSLKGDDQNIPQVMNVLEDSGVSPKEEEAGEESIKTRSQQIDRCCTPGCGTLRRKQILRTKVYFHFPRDLARCQKWLQNCGRKDLLEKTPVQLQEAGYKICSDHFEDSQFQFTSNSMKRLVPDAVPTLFKSKRPYKPSALRSRQKALWEEAQKEVQARKALQEEARKEVQARKALQEETGKKIKALQEESRKEVQARKEAQKKVRKELQKAQKAARKKVQSRKAQEDAWKELQKKVQTEVQTQKELQKEARKALLEEQHKELLMLKAQQKEARKFLLKEQERKAQKLLQMRKARQEAHMELQKGKELQKEAPKEAMEEIMDRYLLASRKDAGGTGASQTDGQSMDVVSDVKVEIDYAEDPSFYWVHPQSLTDDVLKDCADASAASSIPDLAADRHIKVEPMETLCSDTDSVDSNIDPPHIKTEPLDIWREPLLIKMETPEFLYATPEYQVMKMQALDFGTTHPQDVMCEDSQERTERMGVRTSEDHDASAASSIPDLAADRHIKVEPMETLCSDTDSVDSNIDPPHIKTEPLDIWREPLLIKMETPEFLYATPEYQVMKMQALDFGTTHPQDVMCEDSQERTERMGVRTSEDRDMRIKLMDIKPELLYFEGPSSRPDHYSE